MAHADVVEEVGGAPGSGHRRSLLRLRTSWSRRSWGELAVDAAVIFGLAGLAVTQPVLDLFGANPTFFVAGNYGRRQIVAFALVVALVPASGVWLLTALPGVVHRRVGTVLHALGVAALAGLFGLVLARWLGLDGVIAAFGCAAVVGAGVALAEWRWRPVRQFLALLALGNLAFVALFLVASPTTELLRHVSYGDAGNVSVPALDGPVVVLVLDEFPLTALIRPDGSINEVRYPNLAALADEVTWFRNAASETTSTAQSVPTILTGVRADSDQLPTLADHPRNLFTLFGSRYPVQRYEVVTDLCPSDVCEPPPGQPLRQALSDAGLVYRHRVLPAALRADLAPVDQDWGDFGGDLASDQPPEPSGGTSSESSPDPYARLDEIADTDRGRVGQSGALRRQYQLIGDQPSINLIHVLLPHHPYNLTPWGTHSTDSWLPNEMPEPSEPGYERAFAELYALQSLQVGAVDQLVGDMVGHLKDAGAWDGATFVLVSDHGVDISPPGFGRRLDDDTQDELLRIPLFIKAPGQAAGDVRDDPASTIDVLPSIIDLLGIETDWSFDGHSLFDGSEPTADRLITSDLDDLYAHVAWQQEQFPHGENWVAMAAIGDMGDLVGTLVSDHRIGDPSGLSWALADRKAFDDPSSTMGKLPVLMTGTLRGSAEEPPDLVVAIDGTIAGTIGGYSPDGGEWSFTGILGPPGARGEGEEVVAYEVERGGGTVQLHAVAEI